MAIRRMKLMCDFETTTDPEDLRVWASCAVDIDTLETVYLGTDIDGFMEYLSGKNTVCYFHNLKFDGEFIIYWLLKHGFEYNEKPFNKTFSTLITDNGIWYSISVIFEKKNKTYKKVTFYDSLKKLPFPVATIAKAFNLPMSKGEIDYKAYRAPGHEPTPEEKDYIIKDCRIVAEALQIQFAKGLKKMTNASDAMGWYKKVIDKKNFERWFPTFPIEIDSDIRRAYKGGFTYLNPRFKDARGLKGLTLDVNSLYPSVMYDCLLPYGYPTFFEGAPEYDENFPLFIVRLDCAFDLKPGHIPTIQLKNNYRFQPTEYLTTTEGEVHTLVLTSVDLELFLEHYDVSSATYVSGWKFKGAKGLFREYIDYWMHIKETTTGAMRQLAKLMLNSLYGKFATNPRARKKYPGMVEDVVMYALDEVEEREPIYTAMGAFITAYARDKTIRSAQAVYDRFIYADTDSLHLVGYEMPEGLTVHPSHLGAWKHEGYFSDSKYIRAKTYMETLGAPLGASLSVYARWTNKRAEMTLKEFCGALWRYQRELKTVVTCAGMPDNVKKKVNYENFRSGSMFDGKLMPKRYPGGVVLTETTFTIK